MKVKCFTPCDYCGGVEFERDAKSAQEYKIAQRERITDPFIHLESTLGERKERNCCINCLIKAFDSMLKKNKWTEPIKGPNIMGEEC